MVCVWGGIGLMGANIYVPRPRNLPTCVDMPTVSVGIDNIRYLQKK